MEYIIKSKVMPSNKYRIAIDIKFENYDIHLKLILKT